MALVFRGKESPKIMKWLVLMMVVLTFAAGCSTIHARYEYNTAIEFDDFHAYAWFPLPEGMNGGNPVTEYAKETVDGQLKAKGYAPDSESPDFLIALHVGEGKSIDVSTWGYVYGEKPYYHDFNVPYEGTPRDHIHFEYRFDMNEHAYAGGALILDFIDGRNKEMIWRGTAISVVDTSLPPEEMQRRILTGVTKILDNFPPY
jgi:hypothetical protein